MNRVLVVGVNSMGHVHLVRVAIQTVAPPPIVDVATLPGPSRCVSSGTLDDSIGESVHSIGGGNQSTIGIDVSFARAVNVGDQILLGSHIGAKCSVGDNLNGHSCRAIIIRIRFDFFDSPAEIQAATVRQPEIGIAQVRGEVLTLADGVLGGGSQSNPLTGFNILKLVLATHAHVVPVTHVVVGTNCLHLRARLQTHGCHRGALLELELDTRGHGVCQRFIARLHKHFHGEHRTSTFRSSEVVTGSVNMKREISSVRSTLRCSSITHLNGVQRSRISGGGAPIPEANQMRSSRSIHIEVHIQASFNQSTICVVCFNTNQVSVP
mmetsp:Transcript_31125/g.74509  ORF Transcript_31125/g.74509 Transcript_31125/m.74509 type:complete len:323 (-) Transcript_31125:1956-2924(-)